MSKVVMYIQVQYIQIYFESMFLNNIYVALYIAFFSQ
jgi:hypothetical protein